MLPGKHEPRRKGNRAGRSQAEDTTAQRKPPTTKQKKDETTVSGFGLEDLRKRCDENGRGLCWFGKLAVTYRRGLCS
ncbi:hypothetical protein T07_5726 [Trichinella nelsoni]|uniref:Uncharacterized protein n=1 Tax=Trichinella nelsoni TaxID=6336 RepID=A0A0V0RFZ9_9BILA|nr:hypothetical protein T07_5726 [Trichinella nelsoni]